MFHFIGIGNDKRTQDLLCYESCEHSREVGTVLRNTSHYGAKTYSGLDMFGGVNKKYNKSTPTQCFTRPFYFVTVKCLLKSLLIYNYKSFKL